MTWPSTELTGSKVGDGGRNSSAAAEFVVIRGYSSVVSQVAGTLVSHCGDASNTSRGRESERVREYIGYAAACMFVCRSCSPQAVVSWNRGTNAS
jgi:hypothetical protein